MVEVIDLESTTSVCNHLSDHPDVDGGLTAVAVINGAIKSCGGYDDTNLCYDYIPEDNEWITSPSLLHDRYAPRASFIDGQWLVSGDLIHQDSASTDLWTGATFEPGPLLPVNLERPCQATVNSTHVFFADGRNLEPSYLLEWQSQTWTELPSMSTQRDNLSCGLINNPAVGPKVVVAEKGIVEIFSFDTLEWRFGPEAPYFMDAGYAQLKDTFVVVGGNGAGDIYDLDTIFMFDHINYDWIEMEQRLEVPRAWYPGVVAVPNDFVNCH